MVSRVYIKVYINRIFHIYHMKISLTFEPTVKNSYKQYCIKEVSEVVIKIKSRFSVEKVMTNRHNHLDIIQSDTEALVDNETFAVSRQEFLTTGNGVF